MRGQINKRPTLRTIAEIAGLAVPTVSRALSNAPDIGSDTKDRVRRIAKQIGYVPNRAGLRLRTGKTHTIAVVLEAEVDRLDYAGQYVASIAQALKSTNYNLNVVPYLGKNDFMEPVQQLVENETADAVILNGIETEDARVSYLMDQNFPFVTFGRTRWREKHAYFDFDNSDFARSAIYHFADRGRRSVALLAPPRQQNYARDLIAGGQAEAVRRGLKFCVVEGTDTDKPSTEIEAAVANLLSETPEIDAIICPSTGSAIGAMIAADTLGRKIGADLDMYAKEISQLLSRVRPGIFTVHHDMALAGRALADAAIQAIERPDVAPLQELVLPRPFGGLKA